MRRNTDKTGKERGNREKGGDEVRRQKERASAGAKRACKKGACERDMKARYESTKDRDRVEWEKR